MFMTTRIGLIIASSYPKTIVGDNRCWELKVFLFFIYQKNPVNCGRLVFSIAWHHGYGVINDCTTGSIVLFREAVFFITCSCGVVGIYDFHFVSIGIINPSNKYNSHVCKKGMKTKNIETCNALDF